MLLLVKVDYSQTCFPHQLIYILTKFSFQRFARQQSGGESSWPWQQTLLHEVSNLLTIYDQILVLWKDVQLPFKLFQDCESPWHSHWANFKRSRTRNMSTNCHIYHAPHIFSLWLVAVSPEIHNFAKAWAHVGCVLTSPLAHQRRSASSPLWLGALEESYSWWLV